MTETTRHHRAALLAGVTAALVLTLGAPGSSRPDSRDHEVASGAELPLKFVVVGDTGTGGADQAAVAKKMCSWREDHPYDLVLTTGDNIYPSGQRRDFKDNFFTPFSCLYDAGVKFHASLGNHDIVTKDGKPEIDESRFGLPDQNYVKRLAGVRIVVADSSNLKKRWLRKHLGPEEGDRWTVVVFHYPVYSPGTEHGSTESFHPWVPKLFQKRGVDLVLNGHDHIYSASKKLKGIRYVVTGGGGAPIYGCSDKWFSTGCVERHHFLMIRVTAKRLYVTAIPKNGKPFARFSTTGSAP